MIQQLVMVQLPLGTMERSHSARMLRDIPGLLPEAYAMLARGCPNIGGDRSILRTFRLLQGLSNVYRFPNRLVLNRGYFGPQWNEHSGKARKIQGDLVEYLMGDVLPFLFETCKIGLPSTRLPREQELLPLFVAVKAFLKNQRAPIPIALAFGIHTILTGVFEMQGDTDVHDVAAVSKVCLRSLVCLFVCLLAVWRLHRPGSSLEPLLAVSFAGHVPALLSPARNATGIQVSSRQSLKAQFGPDGWN